MNCGSTSRGFEPCMQRGSIGYLINTSALYQKKTSILAMAKVGISKPYHQLLLQKGDKLFGSRFSYIMRDYRLWTIFEKCSDSIFHNLNVFGNAFMLTHMVSPGISNSDLNIVTNICWVLE